MTRLDEVSRAGSRHSLIKRRGLSQSGHTPRAENLVRSPAKKIERVKFFLSGAVFARCPSPPLPAPRVAKTTRAGALEHPGEEIKTMKTMNIKSKEHHRTENSTPSARNPRRFKAAIIASIVALTLACVAEAGTSSKCDACAGTARLFYYSDLNNALADYNIALANANNQPTEDEQHAAKQQAATDTRTR
jgi:hypothetical protein